MWEKLSTHKPDQHKRTGSSVTVGNTPHGLSLVILVIAVILVSKNQPLNSVSGASITFLSTYRAPKRNSNDVHLMKIHLKN